MSFELEKIGSQGYGKRPKDFPKIHDDNVDKILAKISSIESSLSGNDGDITGIESRVTVNEADILELQTLLPAISAYLKSEIDANDVDLSSIYSSITTINSNITNISGDLSSLETDLSDLRSDVESIVLSGGVTLSQLQSLSASLQSQITQNTDDISVLRSQLFNISGGNGGYQGIVHITDVTNAGNIQISYVANTDNSVVDSFISDVSNVTLELTGRSLNETWFPQVEVENTTVSGWSEQSNGKFTTSYAMVLSGNGTIIAQHTDGTSHTISYSIATDGPSVLSATMGSFPTLSWDSGTNQTTLKSGDTVTISGSCENTVTYVEVVDDSGSIFASGNTSVTEGNTTFTLTATVSNRTGSKILKLRARNSLGTYGDTYLGTSATLDQTSPTVGSFSITYPVSQEALKNSETADVSSTVSDFTDIVYSSPNGDLSIPSTTTYGASKTVTRIAGSYNVSLTNYRITARKASNGTETVGNTVVFIANVAATIDVTLPASRLRSGGNDGTSVQNHTITSTSNQRLASFSMSEQSTYGLFTGSWSGATNNTVWTRTLQVDDDDSKGSASWQSVSAFNLSGIETTSLNSGSTYTLGGFVSRNLTLPAFANTVNATVDAVDYTKVTLTWSVKSLPNKRSLGTTTVPDPNSWALTTLTPASVIILDTAATSSSSQASTITLEETV